MTCTQMNMPDRVRTPVSAHHDKAGDRHDAGVSVGMRTYQVRNAMSETDHGTRPV